MSEHDYEKDRSEVDGESAVALGELKAYMELRFAQITERIDHVVQHDRMYPTPGCSICERLKA